VILSEGGLCEYGSGETRAYLRLLRDGALDTTTAIKELRDS